MITTTAAISSTIWPFGSRWTNDGNGRLAGRQAGGQGAVGKILPNARRRRRRRDESRRLEKNGYTWWKFTAAIDRDLLSLVYGKRRVIRRGAKVEYILK